MEAVHALSLVLLSSRSPQFCDMVVRTFDHQGARHIKFDAFIQACVMLKTLTDKFRAKDTQQRGMINISYEDVSDAPSLSSNSAFPSFMGHSKRVFFSPPIMEKFCFIIAVEILHHLTFTLLLFYFVLTKLNPEPNLMFCL